MNIVIKNEKGLAYSYEKIDEGLNNVELALHTLTALQNMINITLGELSHDQMTNLPKDGVKVLWDEVRSRYQFPNASDDFNMKVLGFDFTYVINYYRKYAPTYKNMEINYKKGKYIINEHSKLHK